VWQHAALAWGNHCSSYVCQSIKHKRLPFDHVDQHQQPPSSASNSSLLLSRAAEAPALRKRKTATLSTSAALHSTDMTATTLRNATHVARGHH
jgi:hypothetical protein